MSNCGGSSSSNSSSSSSRAPYSCSSELHNCYQATACSKTAYTHAPITKLTESSKAVAHHSCLKQLNVT
eukprot:11194-Heterococcus_DN1.PRE.1